MSDKKHWVEGTWLEGFNVTQVDRNHVRIEVDNDIWGGKHSSVELVEGLPVTEEDIEVIVGIVEGLFFGLRTSSTAL